MLHEHSICNSTSSIWHLQPLRVWASSFLRFHDHTHGHTTVGRTPLDEGSARRKTWQHTTFYNRQTFVPPAGFKPAILVSERPQTYALDCSATGIGFAVPRLEKIPWEWLREITKNRVNRSCKTFNFKTHLRAQDVTFFTQWSLTQLPASTVARSIKTSQHNLLLASHTIAEWNHNCHVNELCCLVKLTVTGKGKGLLST